ncbi:large ribosomal subunit protein mL40-like [Eulemur rufifrons]|uniref:large ribosomal subunit protein mL40-like n=1 Tax=Eulemur rufifrons TaxID=859984 RepID=UPI003743AFBB
MAAAALRSVARALHPASGLLGTSQTQIRNTHQRASLLSFWELIPMRQRTEVELSFEESERRVLLLKRWSLYKQREHEMEKDAIRTMLEAQQEALQELQLESPELHTEAIKQDPGLFPFEKKGPDYTPLLYLYQPPEGRYNDITKVYTQMEFKK